MTQPDQHIATRGYIANTDWEWYQHFLRRDPPVSAVNFWRPGGTGFRAIPVGAPFFFRLKAPRNVIGGFGFFSRFVKMEAWRAWQVFDDLNGAPDLPSMLRRLVGYRQHSGDPAAARTGDFVIGCIVVSQPTFFTPDEWVRDDPNWKPNIVSGKGVDVLSGEGQRILRVPSASRSSTPTTAPARSPTSTHCRCSRPPTYSPSPTAAPTT
jgi:putative restriction endonuclease